MSNPKIEQRLVAGLIPYAANSRTHSDAQVAQIAASIKEFGWTNPILIDGDNTIIAGHGRLLAARKLGMEEVPAIILDHLTKAQQRALVIADNQLALNAGWDMDMLKAEIEDLNLDNFDINLLGFDEKFLDGLLEPEPTDGLTDEDAVPEVPETPKTVLGDVWVLGNHRLMCGDSTSVDAVDKLMDGAKADAIITDPPYNQETEGGFKGEIGKSLKKQSANIEHMCNFDPKTVLPILPLMHYKNKMNATIFCNKDLVPDYLNWARECGYSFNILIWKKPSAIPLGGSYMPDVEYCLILRKSAKFNTKVAGVSYSKVLVHARETGLHPTMKPVAMLENQIKIVSDANDIVADIFGGSGSTLIACEKTNRNARLMELDPKYCDVIIKRWQDFTGKKAVHAETGEAFDDGR
jgi:DNA modification methylase